MQDVRRKIAHRGTRIDQRLSSIAQRGTPITQYLTFIAHRHTRIAQRFSSVQRDYDLARVAAG